MRRFIAAAATAAVLLMGCVVDVDEEGFDTANVGADTMGDMGDVGFDPDDCFLDVLVPEEELEEDFGVYEKAVTAVDTTLEPRLLAHPTPWDKHQMEDTAAPHEDPCDAAGLCHWQTVPR